MGHHGEGEFGYDNGKGYWLIVVLVLGIAAMCIGYSVVNFFPDLSNWMKEGNPDAIQWERVLPKR